MATSLSAFFAQNAKKVEVHKYPASSRFVGEDGKPIEWKYGCITGKENTELNKRFGDDRTGYTAALVAKCTVFPDLNNAELQDSYGVKSAEDLVQAMLISGEYSTYASKVFEANKFGVTPEKIEEAKN